MKTLMIMLTQANASELMRKWFFHKETEILIKLLLD